MRAVTGSRVRSFDNGSSLKRDWPILLVVLCSLLGSASAIKCYVCSSYSDLYCSEDWELGDLSDEIQPVECDQTYEAQYCVKTTGMYQGEIGTQRFCSAKHLGNYCDWNSRPGDLGDRGQKREYRSCIYTCGVDGCNSVVGLTPNLLAMAFVLTLTVLYRVFSVG